MSVESEATLVNPRQKAKHEDLGGNGNIWILLKGIREQLQSDFGHELFELTILNRWILERSCT